MPIFIGGMFKSGTSLARKYLGNHPTIFSGLETNWFEFDKLFNDEKFDIKFKVNIWSAFFKIDVATIENIIKQSKCSEEILDNLMQTIINKSNFKFWCDKSPPNITHGERIFKYWSNAKLVHIIRDPLDVFCSCKEAKKWDNPNLFVDTWSKIFNNLNKLRTNKNYLEIHYEDLILDRIETLKNFYNFCELEWDNKYSEHFEEKNEYLLVKEKTGKDSTTLKRLSEPITKKRIGIGSQKLSSVEVNQIINIVKDKNLFNEFNRASWNKL